MNAPRRIEQEAAEEEILLDHARMVEHGFDAIFLRDADDRIIRWNRGAAAVYGWSREEAVGQVSHAFLKTEFPKPLAEILADLHRDGTWEGELVHSAKDGHRVTALTRWVLERDARNQKRFVLETDKDISTRKAAEEEVLALNRQLRQQLEQLNTLLEILPVGVWIGNADCSQITGNPAAYRMMGLRDGINASVTTGEPEVPTGLRLFVDGKEVRPEDAPLQQVARSGEPLNNFEHELRFPDGTTKTIYGSAAPLFDEQGRVRQVIAAYADYTDRKQSDDERRKRAEDQAALFEQAPTGIVVVGQDGTIVSANVHAELLFGYARNELAGKPIEALVPMNARDQHPALRRAFSADPNARPMGAGRDLYGLRKDGTEIPVEIGLSPLRTANGIVVVASIVDISERKREETRRELLLRAVERFNASFDYDATLKTVAREVVPTIADWCAIDILEGDELRRVAAEHVDPAKVALVEAIERSNPPTFDGPGSPRSVMQSGKPFLWRAIPKEVIGAVANGDAENADLLERLRLHSAMVVPMIGPRGPVGVLSLITAESRREYSDADVAFASTLADRAATAIENARLVRALEAAVGREKRARYMMERMQAAIAAMSRAKTPSEVADAACRIGAEATGAYAVHLWLSQPDGGLSLIGTWRASESTIGQFRTIPADADTPATRVLRTGQPVWIETEEAFERASPEIYAIVKATGRMSAFAVLPLEGSRKTLGVINIAHHFPHEYDGDERAFCFSLAQHCAQALERARLFENEQLARAQAEDAAKFSELFMGVVSHDLRNPLNAIVTGAQLIFATATEDRPRRTATRVASSAQRMARMIDQLLDFTRIRLGQGLSIEPAATNLAELAREIADEIEAAHGCKIKLERVGAGTGIWDGDRLGQVLSNLLANAATHGTNGSPVVLALDGTAPGAIKVRVRNEGQIPAAIFPQIFEPFRGSKYQRGVARGLGLGLHITREIIRAHGGTIDVTSNEGGTTFEFHLPREARAPARGE